jgi:hypothetical protein
MDSPSPPFFFPINGISLVQTYIYGDHLGNAQPDLRLIPLLCSNPCNMLGEILQKNCNKARHSQRSEASSVGLGGLEVEELNSGHS